ncbi:hypothetical protein MKW92_025149 [Papaver armeniacum]|nr:hypothetical protein MKW92_025149 [Papaver armeniacum]
MDYAHKLFDQITEPDLFIWNPMIRAGYAKRGELQAMLSVGIWRVQENSWMKSSDEIAGFVLAKSYEKASEMFER